MRHQCSRLVAATFIAVLFGSVQAPDALAGGYDTPILYTARHIGMGGTAISFVDDASAVFHNPAGMGHMRSGNVIANFSLLTGGLIANPAPVLSTRFAASAESNQTVAPFFLVGGGARITDWLTLGLAVYPVASAGAVYEYTIVEPKASKKDGLVKPGFELSTDIYDETRLVFFEFSPAVAINLPGNFHLGFGYRISLVQFDRVQQTPGDEDAVVDFSTSGLNFEGFRMGLQWAPIEELQLGAVYRFKTRTRTNGDEAQFLRIKAEPDVTPLNLIEDRYDRVDAQFVLPAKFGFGVRTNFTPVSLAADLEYTFNSANRDLTFKFTDNPDPDTGAQAPAAKIVNYMGWHDNLTLRLGAEYCFTMAPFGLDHQFKARLGYVFDGQVASKAYPSAAGTPPVATQSFTVGAGYDGGPWAVNFAYAYRFGNVTVAQSDIPNGNEVNVDTCSSCGKHGYYEINLHGIYLDFSWDFD